MIAKKNLVAAAALMAVAAAAQAQSSVKLYGTLDYAVGSYETAHTKGDNTRTTKVQSGDMMTSYIGFAGSEDLGGGLKAEFALESFIGGDTGANVTNNAGNYWSRTSNVALSGGFGKVAIGQYDNPLFTSGYTYNPFGSSMTFSPTMRHLGYIGQTGVGGVGFDTGWINSVTYESAVMSGVQIIGQYAAKESTAAGAHNSYTVAASYNNGPLSAMLTYVDAGYTPKGPNPLQTYNGDEKVIDLGASYDFGVVKGFAQYTSIKEAANAAASTAKNKDAIFQLGVTAPINDKASVMASYGELKNTVKATDVKKKDRVFSVGYDYMLSKRTDVYGVFMTNSQTGKESGQTVAVGVKHNF